MRHIRRYIENTEPRFDPTVFPKAESHIRKDKQDNEAEHGVQDLHERQPKKNSVTAYRSLYLSGELTPLDVVHAILPLIRKDSSPPGEHSVAWFDVQVDQVLDAAKASTLRYKAGKSLGPLDGVPTAVKDEYDIKGYSTSLGSINDYTRQESNDNDMTSWCVVKLEEAGAIVMGKLSMHEFGLGNSMFDLRLSNTPLTCTDTSGNNITYGTPRNPYNSRYYTGGSSSGSAYAVASGLVPIALGSDGGGSIRIPASFCSIFGLKPTHGRLSSHPGQNHSNTCGVNGPMGVDMRSLAALYSVVCEPHPTSDFPPLPTTPFSILDSLSNIDRNKVIGIPESWFERATPAIQTLCRDLVDWLAAHKGYTVVPIHIPMVTEGQIAHAMTVLNDAATLLPDTRGLSPANRVLLALGRTTPATDFLLAQKLRHVLMRHLAWLWQEVHPGMVIVTPTTKCAGWPIRTASELRYGVSDGDQTIESMEYVWLGNFCGVPSLSVPAGYVVPEGQDGAGTVAGPGTVGEVPVGLMATGEWGSEDALIQFGLDAEEAGACFQHQPSTWVDVVDLAREQKKSRDAR